MRRITMRLLLLLFLNCISTLAGWAQQDKAGRTQELPSTQGKPGEMTKGYILPQEMVFVHMDNTCYFLGDTLYYKAYVQRSDTGKPTDLSEVLYADLYNQDGYLVERQILRMKKGQAHGDFFLGDSLYAGFYELRVYTRWQLNWGRTERPHNKEMDRWFLKKAYAQEFFTDYEKLYSRVFPVYDKPKVPGELYRNMTLRPLRRDYAEEKSKERAIVTLYPEGGNLIKGLNQRIAFEANSETGQHLMGKVMVLNQQKQVVAEGPVQNRGRGIVELKIDNKQDYTIIFRDTTGQESTHHLPPLREMGAVMTVCTADTALLSVEVQTQGLMTDSMRLFVLSCGRAMSVLPVGVGKMKIPTSSLPSGVVQLLLMDGMETLSDRLVFVQHDEVGKGTVWVEGMKDAYDPLEAVRLKIKGYPNSHLSISVRDYMASDSICDNGNIMTEMLLSSHIKGFVEDPGYYFRSNDGVHRRHLDLLMMVQGWRRFESPSQRHQFRIEEPYESSQFIRGEVSNYDPLEEEDRFFLRVKNTITGTVFNRGKGGPLMVPYVNMTTPFLVEQNSIKDNTGKMVEVDDRDENGEEKNRHERMKTEEEQLNTGTDIRMFEEASILKKPVETFLYEFIKDISKETLVHAEFIQMGAAPVYGEMNTYDKGHFNVWAPHFYGSCITHIASQKQADVQKSKKKHAAGSRYQWVLPNSKEYAPYSIRLYDFYPRFVQPYSFYQTLVREKDNTVFSHDATTMKEVLVRSKRKMLRKIDLSKPALVLDAYDTFNQIVDAGITCAYYTGSTAFSNNIARLFVGDMGINRGYDMERRWNGRNISTNSIQNKTEQHKYNYLENLDKVYIYTDYAPRKEGNMVYDGNDQPTVTIDIHRYMDDSKRPTFRDRFYVWKGYHEPAEFYSPDYSRHPLPEGQKDYRRTLYWNPNLPLDENGEAKVTFYNNSRTTHLTVDAQGQASDGTLLWTQP